MPTPSLARDLFDRIVTAADPVAAIRGLITSDPPTFESDVFDCKLEPIEPKLRDAKHKELWSEVLGGFSNAGGGVVIWGLDASKKREIDGRQIDAVCGEKPIHNPLAVESRLRELQRQATDPPLAGVEIRSYTLPEDPARGFIICYVPEGPYKPYRSEHADKHYYLRAGDNTPIMSRAVLASMFHPRSRVRFRAIVEWELTWEGDRARPACRVSLLNTGTATARDVFVRVTWRMPAVPIDMKVLNATRMLDTNAHDAIQVDHPLHPGFSSVLFFASWEVTRLYYETATVRGYVAGDIPAYVYLEVFSDNQEPVNIEIPVNMAEIIRKGKHHVEADSEDGVRNPEE